MLPDPILRHQIAEATRCLLLSGVRLRRATMDNVARQLRISKKTIYQQFATKERLLDTLLAEHLNQAHALGHRVSKAATAEAGLAQLTSWLAAQVSEVSLQLVADFRTHFPDLWGPWWAAYQQELYHLLTACLHRGMAEQCFRPNLDVEVLGRLLLAQLDLLATGELFPPEHFAPRRVYEQLIHHFLQGIKYLAVGP